MKIRYCKECTLAKPLDGEGRCAVCAEVVRSLEKTQAFAPLPVEELWTCVTCGMHTKCTNCELWGHP